MKIKMPVLDVKLVETTKIVANNYNLNRVATPEIKLLEVSIKEDGFTQPIVSYYDEEQDIYIIVDGFHRYNVGKKLKLKKLPVITIDKPIEDRIASTIRHNRARGVHVVDGMSEVINKLLKRGVDDAWIKKHIGMDKNEILRLKQISGLGDIFRQKKFSKSWEEVEEAFKEK